MDYNEVISSNFQNLKNGFQECSYSAIVYTGLEHKGMGKAVSERKCSLSIPGIGNIQSVQIRWDMN